MQRSGIRGLSYEGARLATAAREVMYPQTALRVRAQYIVYSVSRCILFFYFFVFAQKQDVPLKNRAFIRRRKMIGFKTNHHEYFVDQRNRLISGGVFNKTMRYKELKVFERMPATITLEDFPQNPIVTSAVVKIISVFNC